jgi:protein-disulfide isomerase
MGKERMDAGRGRGKGVVAKSGGSKSSNRGFYLLLIILLIAGVGTLSYLSARRTQVVSQVDSTLAPIPNTGHSIGSDSAKIEVVEFGDFECPACGSFTTLTEPDVRDRLVKTGIVRFRFMDYPLPIHRNTWPAHRAAWCAGEQNKFWEMHDLLFLNQDRWNGETTDKPDAMIQEFATQLGLNIPQYKSCVETRKYQAQIQSNATEAERRGVGSTPTFFIGANKIATAISYDEFKKYVDQALATANANKPAAKTTR